MFLLPATPCMLFLILFNTQFPGWVITHGTSTNGSTSAPRPESTAVPPLKVCMNSMGIENQYTVADNQLTASSSIDNNHTASDGRLYNDPSPTSGGSWIPGSKCCAWIKVDFLEPKTISGVVTQGSPDIPLWVKQFYVYLSTDGQNFAPYTGNQADTTPYLFNGNTDQNTPVRNLFNRHVVSRYLKIVPVKSSPDGIGLRLNVLGCEPPLLQYPVPTPAALDLPPKVSEVCLLPMGIENHYIVTDGQLTASSSIDNNHTASDGRLFNDPSPTSGGSWIPGSKYCVWIKVDFLEPKYISGVETQGSPDVPLWVEQFYVYLSTDGQNFAPYTGNQADTTPYLFTGNTDQNTPVRNLFNRNVFSRYVKIVPVKSSPDGIGLRINVLGCDPYSPGENLFPTPAGSTGVLLPPFATTTTTTTANPNGWTAIPGCWTTKTCSLNCVNQRCDAWNGTCINCPPGKTGAFCDQVCLLPMGIESPYIITDDQLTASSSIDNNHTASDGRIYNYPSPSSGGSWIPGPKCCAWIKVDFLEPKTISGVETQGSPDIPLWVKQFYVYLSTDGQNFAPYTENQADTTPYLFTGNTDQNTPVRNLFNRHVVSRYVKIVPVKSSPDGIGLKINVFGCEDPYNFSDAVPTPRPESTVVPTVPIIG